MMRWGMSLLSLLLSGLMSFAQASSEQSVLLSVNYRGVEVRLANTDAWLPLRQGAQMPLRAGDAVRTSHTGRLVLDFPFGQVLLLPNSEWQLSDLQRQADARYQVAMFLPAGRLVYAPNATSPEQVAQFSLATPTLNLIQADDALVLLEYDPVNPSTSLLFIGNVVTFSAFGQTRQVGEAPTDANETSVWGMQATAEILSETLSVPYPAFPAKLDAMLYGCLGVVQAQGRDSLNVREGAGEGYEVIGVLENGTPVLLRGETPFRQRVRVPYGGGWGWILGSGVQNTCEDLPSFPYSQRETLFGVLAPSPAELAILRPFYGTPQDNQWFYLGFATLPR